VRHACSPRGLPAHRRAAHPKPCPSTARILPPAATSPPMPSRAATITCAPTRSPTTGS
jgi:hypothetical protein